MIRFFNITVLMALVLSVSCARVGDYDGFAEGGHPVLAEGEVAQVDVCFGIASQVEVGEGASQGGSIVARGVGTDEGTAQGYTPLDVWVIQYGGTADDSPLMGQPRYVELSAQGETAIQAVGSTDRHTLIFIANTHDANLELGDIASLGLMKLACKTIRGQQDCYGSNLHTANDLILSGMYQGFVATGSILVTLSRNIARLDLTLRNGAASGLTLCTVELCNVPRNMYYTSVLRPTEGIFPLESEFFDYPAQDILGAANPGGVQEFTFYMPVNERSTVAASTNSELRASLAPSYASYLRIMAVDADNQAYIYKIYPGANLTDDYNLSANKRYRVELSINSPGQAVGDGRVEHYGRVDFASSNSFILNPSPLGTKDRVFTIPIDRVNEFWGEIDPSLTITEADSWTVDVIWQDTPTQDFMRFIDLDDGSLSTTFSGTGPAQRIAVRAKAGDQGNALIGIKKTGQITPGYLWSWHLWVTPYQPDYQGVALVDQYVYSVRNGDVHRYGGALWTNTTGKYRNKFIMDRNLGTRHAGYTNLGALYYQFGRKDPLPCNIGGNLIYDVNGVLLASDNPNNPSTNAKNAADGVTIATAVLNPTSYYTKSVSKIGDWTNQGKLSPYAWNNRIQGKDLKSLYDPCPHGWKLPESDVWSDFRYVLGSPMACTTLNVERDQKLGWYYNNEYGLRYWPLSGPVRGRIYISSIGLRAYHTGVMSNRTASGYLWSSTPYSVLTGEDFYATAFRSGLAQDHARAYGVPVRCIQE